MPETDYKALTFYLHVFEFICIGVVGVYTWLVNRHKANADAIGDLGKALRTEMNELDDRVIRVEKSIEHLPTHKDIEQLNRRIDDVAQEVRKLEGTLVQVNNSVQMIHQHLLNAKEPS